MCTLEKACRCPRVRRYCFFALYLKTRTFSPNPSASTVPLTVAPLTRGRPIWVCSPVCHQQYILKLHSGSRFGIESFHADDVPLGNPILLSTTSYDCIHGRDLLWQNTYYTVRADQKATESLSRDADRRIRRIAGILPGSQRLSEPQLSGSGALVFRQAPLPTPRSDQDAHGVTGFGSQDVAPFIACCFSVSRTLGGSGQDREFHLKLGYPCPVRWSP